MPIKTFLVIVFCAITIQTVYSVPAIPTSITIKQPNGKTLTMFLCGDEYFHWGKTLDSYTLVTNNEGFWCYAILNDEGYLVASNYLAANKEERTNEENKFLSMLPPNLRFSDAQLKKSKANNFYVDKTKVLKSYPTQGTVKLLVILVSFSDLPFTYTNADFVSLVSDSNYNGTGSVKDYYLENSYGQFTMDIDVKGPVTIPHPMAYYGLDTIVNGYRRQDYRMYDFLADALNAADAASTDFTVYDNDNDGEVDAIHFIFAGTPQSSTGNTNEIWPHRYNIDYYNSSYYGNRPNIWKDGKRITNYSCSAEKRNATTMDGIGTICHEFGHVLGYPDFYDTDDTINGDAVHPSSWDLMASGSYNNNGATPAGLNAWEKSYCGWITPISLSIANDSLILPALTDDTIAYKITLSSNEFFMIENRQQKSWDAYLPGKGMLIWHGDNQKLNASGNSVNANANDRGWFIEPASGNYNQTVAASATFPGTTGNTLYTNNSNPAAKLKNGTLINKPITEIHYTNDSTIVFAFFGSRPVVQTLSQVYDSLHATSAYVKGNIIYQGSQTITQCGFYWNTDANELNVNPNIVTGTLSNDTIGATLSALTPYTTIYYKAFVITISNDTVTGNVMQLTTPTGLGTVSTSIVINIGYNTATAGGYVSRAGDASIISRGIVYTSNANITPDINNSTIVTALTADTGSFNVNLTGLAEGLRYYVRAFVTTSLGTAYGSKLNFRTNYHPVNNNTISGNQTLCSGSTPSIITGSTPTDGLGNFTYFWEQKGRTGNNWIAATGTNNEQNYQPPALTDTTLFRRIVISNGTIQDTSNSVLMTVLTSVGGKINKLVGDTIGIGESTDTLRLSGYKGTVIDWERQFNTEGWQSLSNISTKYIETLEAEGNYSYRVKVQIEQCEADYSTELSIIASSLSLPATITAHDLNIFPNPSNDIITITTNLKDNADILITNSLGQIVYASSNENLQNKKISLKHLDNGIYFITINTKNETVKKQIIINK